MYFPINTIILILIFAAIIALQVFFSKKENKWLGLILPAIFFVYSLLMVLNVAVFDDMSGWDVFSMLASTFLLSNIPTLILLGIYFAYRGKIKRNDELNKMNIQDL
jgi:hypothetical protein